MKMLLTILLIGFVDCHDDKDACIDSSKKQMQPATKSTNRFVDAMAKRIAMLALQVQPVSKAGRKENVPHLLEAFNTTCFLDR